MENLPVNNGNGQAFGYVLYETTIFSSGILSGHVCDRGQVGASPLNSQDFVVTRHVSTYLILCLHNQLLPVCKIGYLSYLEIAWSFPRNWCSLFLLMAKNLHKSPQWYLFYCLVETPPIFLSLTMIFISLWQVFLNRIFIGFLDYKTTKITIPLTQVCYPRVMARKIRKPGGSLIKNWKREGHT